MQTDTALELAKLVNSDDFQRKLNDLVKERQASQEEAAKAERAKEQAESTAQATAKMAAAQQAELDAGRTRHDKAAAEAKLRIDLANSMRVELEKKKSDLDERQASLEQREKVVEAARAQFVGALAQLNLIKP